MARNVTPLSTTLKAAVDDYLDWHALRGSSKRHRNDIRRRLLTFITSTGSGRLLDQVTRDNCLALHRAAQERGSKPSSIKAYHRVLDAFFNWTLEEERLEALPMKRVPKPKLRQE